MSNNSFKDEKSDSESYNSSKDFGIFPHRDHVKSGFIPFNLADYGEKGALTKEQIQSLCDRHGLSVSQIGELSRLIGYALDIDSQVSLVTITRAMAESRLNDRSLAKRQRDMQLTAPEANALFDSFGLKIRVLDDAEAYGAGSSQLSEQVKQPDEISTVSLDEARRVLQPNDRTKERDQRRLLVVESCCYIAMDAGWSLTYTTDFKAETNQRGGRLIDLIKDVIAMVSRNARIASVHTLKSDIESVKRRLSLRGESPVTLPRGETK